MWESSSSSLQHFFFKNRSLIYISLLKWWQSNQPSISLKETFQPSTIHHPTASGQTLHSSRLSRKNSSDAGATAQWVVNEPAASPFSPHFLEGDLKTKWWFHSEVGWLVLVECVVFFVNLVWLYIFEFYLICWFYTLFFGLIWSFLIASSLIRFWSSGIFNQRMSFEALHGQMRLFSMDVPMNIKDHQRN